MLLLLLGLHACGAPRGPRTIEGIEASLRAESLEAQRIQALLEVAPVAEGPSGDGPVAFHAREGVLLQGNLGRPEGLAMALVGVLSRSESPGYRHLGPDDPLECGPPWTCPGLAELPTSVLVAAQIVASPSKRGAELDLIARASDGARYVTARHEADGTIVTAAARVDEVPLPAVDAVDPALLQARYGIGALDGGSKPWAPHELASLAEALSLLDAEELRRLEGVEFRREKLPRRGASAFQAGEYRIEQTRRATRHWIEIYDRAFESDDVLFIGTVDRPWRPSVQVILHEAGHAISVAPMVAVLADMGSSTRRFNDTVTAFNRQGRRLRPDELPRFERAAQDMERVGREVSAANRELQTWLDRNRQTSPIVADFSTVRGAYPGITPYGRTTIVESFAEAFSMCRLDREACDRVSPDLGAYFDAGRHLRGEAGG